MAPRSQTSAEKLQVATGAGIGRVDRRSQHLTDTAHNERAAIAHDMHNYGSRSLGSRRIGLVRGVILSKDCRDLAYGILRESIDARWIDE
jgi:hypothetical protein